MTGFFGAPDLRQWRVTRLTLGGSRKIIARRWAVTYVYNEQADGSWFGTKIQGGRVIAERQFGSTPGNIAPILNPPRRRAA